MNEESEQLVNTQMEDDRIAVLILRYLSAHPQAMDTIEGITDWWVIREWVRDEMEPLLRALQQLTDRGVIEVCGSEIEPCYRLKQREWWRW